jgi:D-serine deaminase-like pyridoxal phosphate-dependent protein
MGAPRITSYGSRAAAPGYDAYRALFAGCELPLAYVDLELLAANIAAVAARAAGKRVRVASKSIRSRPLLARILAASPALAGVMCYTIHEALFLSRHGLDDLLVGYPACHPGQLAAVCDAVAAGATITLMLDSAEHVALLARAAAARGVTLPVCLDVDLSLELPGLHFGVRRSGVRGPADALALHEAIAREPCLRLDGVMGYEAQVAGVGDNAPGQGAKNAIVRVLQARSRRLAARRRAEVVAALRARGVELRFVNGGGTGSLESTAREPAVTEVSAGSAFYAPSLFDQYRAFRHLPAAGFAVEIVRRPRPDIFTCLGGGYVASGAAGPEKLPTPYLPAGAALLPLEGAGEVQTPVRYRGPERLGLGDPIFMRHAKAGELCEHFNTLLLVAGGSVVDVAPTYRGEGMAFL